MLAMPLSDENKVLNNVTLTIGDPSGDGHSKTERFVINTNFTVVQIQKAYKAGSKKLGFNFIDECCCDYEDHVLNKNIVDKLRKNGLDDHLKKEEYILYLEDEPKEGQVVYSDTDLHSIIYCFIVSLGDPKFTYEFVQQHISNINIGGYGLFY